MKETGFFNAPTCRAANSESLMCWKCIEKVHQSINGILRHNIFSFYDKYTP
jgi:hypothetical protein